MKRLVIIFIIMTMCMASGRSQTNTTKGIDFVHNLSWEQVLEKARTEKKYVFVDCYATWCGTCKVMDSKVYPDDSIGGYMNHQFICVRVQMDRTKEDNENVQSWYSIAQAFEKHYHIGAYPSFLIFTSEGAALQKVVGAMGINKFLSMARAALDTTRQYYTLLNKFQGHSLGYASIPALAEAAVKAGEDSVSTAVAADYIHNYLERLSAEKLWTNDNILFVNRFSRAIAYCNWLFLSYFQHRAAIDSLMNDPLFADNLINRIVYRDRIEPAIRQSLQTGIEPSWTRLIKKIGHECNAYYASQNIIRGRVEYYKSCKKWTSYITWYIRQLEQNGIDNWQATGVKGLYLNNAAYDVFQYSDNRRELEKALVWVDRALLGADKGNAEAMDTKANILYKLGRTEEGIALEEKTYALSPSNADIKANYDKMKQGLPTWLTE